jgi:PAS domain S-box-containing protein
VAENKSQSSNISISVLTSILNGMDAYLYVTDPETDEILFINDKMKNHFGIEDSGVGKTCWKILQKNMTSRCDFCPLHKLREYPDEVVVWEETNPVTGRTYQNSDSFIEWTGNRLVHLQHSVDITDMKNAERNIVERLEQQELMSAMSQSFISPDSMQNLINNALRMVGVFMNVSFIVLMLYDPEHQTLVLKNSWNNVNCPTHSGTMPFHAGRLEYDSFITKKLEDVVYDDISEVKDLTLLSQCGVKAFIQVPFTVDGKFRGIISFNECSSVRNWTASDIQLIRHIGSVISGVVEHHKMEERYRRVADIVNSSPQYISYTDAGGIFEFLNQGALDLLGYRLDELVGKNISSIMDEQTYRYALDHIIPTVLKDGKLEFEISLIRKDGEVRLLAASGFKNDFSAESISVIAVDITDKRQLEKELRIAMEQAEASNRAKSEFLSRMSHEMRTPMNAIIGMTSIAKSSPDAEKKDYCLDKVEEASVHLLGIINDVLDMSKIEAGKFDLSETEFIFEKMLIRIINVVNFRIAEKKQKFIVHADPTISYYVIADEQRISQVIANLLSNAVKFTPEGGTITLSVENLKDDGDYVLKRISVTDTGIGITKKQQENLFRSFEQADGGISRKFGGTGLGLVISKKIIELMGGEIWVESEIGKGSSFIFDIRVKKGSLDRMALLSPNIDWKLLRILVVDDDQDELDYFKGLADSLKMHCDTALNGDDALTILEQNRNNPFNLIFVDFYMPGMNGIELTRKIVSQYSSAIVIMLISAAEWDDVDHEAKLAGVRSFIPKPIFSTQILNSINTFISPQKRSDKNIDEENPAQNIFAEHRILLAEDIDINREIVMGLLESTGVKIDIAENGIEAIRKFEESPSLYNAILMDIHMPEMDGFEATRKIRQLDKPNAQTIPIIAMTANVFKEDIDNCFAAGMNDHIGKPIDFDNLMHKLKKYLLHE